MSRTLSDLIYYKDLLKDIVSSRTKLDKKTTAVFLNISDTDRTNDKLVLPFNYDKNLNKFWNDPMKYIPRFQSAMAVGTPDYSVYPSMNPIEIEHNVYMGRWLGCLWQTYGCTVLPGVSWWGEDTL